jgi:hydroxycarboxylate dehydrogenase B
MPCLQAGELRSLAGRLFEALRVPPEEAACVAESLVRADLAGHDSHGVIRIPQYAQAIRSALIQPGAPFEITQESPSLALIDGHRGLGQVVARRAMELAILKAKATKISSVGAYNLYHVGRLADYTRMAAEQELVGIMTVNAGGASPLVAPFGGTAGRLGTNPISIAFPTGGSVPFVLDMATSVMAEGKVRAKRHRGEQTPEGWLIDHEGRPTTDPNVLYQEPRGGDSAAGGAGGPQGLWAGHGGRDSQRRPGTWRVWGAGSGALQQRHLDRRHRYQRLRRSQQLSRRNRRPFSLRQECPHRSRSRGHHVSG